MSVDVVDKARRIRQREIESMAEVPEPDILGKGTEAPAIQAYKATGDPDENDEITVKRIDSDGVVTGPEETWKVLPE